MAEYYYDKGIRKKVKEGYTISSKGTIVKASKKKKKKEEDIAPVKKTTGGNKNSWIKSGGYSDGITGVGDFLLDTGKTILGTKLDISLGVAKGVTRLGEGIVDLGAYGVAGIADALGNEKLAKKVKKSAQKDWTTNAFKKPVDFADKYSILGNKADNITQGIGTVAGILATGGVAGYLGAGGAAATAITTGVTGLSGMGSGMSEAYQNKATDKEAVAYGAIAGVAEAATELLFGGLGKGVKALGISKGLSSADDMLAKKITNKFTNQIAKNFTQFGIKAGAEGTEEVLSGIAQAVGKKVTYMSDKDLSQLIEDEDLLDQFIVGSITSGIAQSGYVPGMKQGSLREANKAGTDFITGLTQNEQKVVDKEYENRIAEAEESGKTLSKKEKNKIYDEVVSDMEKGYISTDTIESAIGGKTYETYKNMTERENAVKKEIESLENKPFSQITVKEQEKLTELRKQLETMEKSGLKNKVKSQLSSEVSELALSTKLSESYNEQTRRSQAFQADITKYDAKQQETIKKAIESKTLNNSNRTHEFVDLVAKISADKGVSFDFTNNKKLKESGFAVEGKTVNGYVKDGNIAVNIDSNKSLNSVVGHEITHTLEGTELYTELQNAVKEYATTKGEYDTRLNELSELYKGVEGSNVENELTADLVGDYLFTDKDFINNLSTKKPNIFKRIYDEIKYLCKIATAGSKEARQLEKVKRTFDKAYKEANVNVETNTEVNADTNTDAKVDVKTTDDKKYSLSDSDGKTLTKEQQEYFKDSKVRDENGNLKVMYHGTPNGDYTVFRDGTYFTESKDYADRYQSPSASSISTGKVASNPKTFEVYLNIEKPFDISDPEARDIYINEYIKGGNAMGINPYMSDSEYAKIDTIDWTEGEDLREFLIDNEYDYDGLVLDEGADGGYGDEVLYRGKSYVVFNPEQIKNIDNTNPTEDADIRFSLSKDSEGRNINLAVQKRFEKSKAVDENGNLKVLYHGTPSGDFTIFDKSKGSVEGDFGSGFYFTDNKADVEVNYEGGGPDFENKVARRAEQLESEEDIEYSEAEKRAREELFKGSKKFEVYLNVENPAIVGETMLLNPDDYYSEYEPDDFDSEEEYEGEIEQLVADDIEQILWDIEQNIDLYSNDGISDVLWNAINEGGIDVEQLKANINDLYLEDNEGNFVGNEVTRQIIESLGYDGIIDNTVSSKFSNMGIEEGTTHYIVFKPNQIKSITNENPTDNPDINLSLSKHGKTTAPYGNYNVYGKDVALKQDFAPTFDDIAPLTEEQANTRDAEQSLDTMQSEEFEKLVQSYMDDAPGFLFDDEDIRAWAEEQARQNPQGATKENTVVPESPLDKERDIFTIGKERKTNAYMYENPEVKPFFQDEARTMLWELQNSTRGKKERMDIDAPSEEGWYGTHRHTSNEIAYLLDTFKYKYDDITKGLMAIIEDNGAENNAISKRIEFMLDDRLREGYTDFMSGEKMPPNQDYVNLLNEKQITEYNEEARNKYMQPDIAPLTEEQANKRDAELEQAPVVEPIVKDKFKKKAKKKVEEVNETPASKLENAETEIANLEQLKQDSYDSYTDKINKLQNEYEAKKNKDTKVANNILRRIERLKRSRADVEADYSKRLENANKRKDLIKRGHPTTRSEHHANIIENVKEEFTKKGYDLDEVLENANNLITLATVDNTPQRVMNKALGYKEGNILSDLTVNKVAQNESKAIKWLDGYTNRKTGVLAQLVNEYKIKPGSKESAAAQMYAEGFYVDDKNNVIKYGDNELAKDFPNEKVRNRIKGLASDPRIRQIYDETLDLINESRVRNAYEEIPRRKDYFLHFRAMDDTFSTLGLPFNPNDIKAKDLPTDLNGVTVDLQPGQPYFASAKRRMGNKTSHDLLGGLERYLSSAKNQIYHIDDIQNFRAIRNYIADKYGQAHGFDNISDMTEEEFQKRVEEVYNGHLSTFAKFLNEEANIIAGKTSLLDRGVEGLIGRRALTFLNTVNKQVGSNMVGLNVSSAGTNFLPVVETFARTNKADFFKAFTQTVSNKIRSIYGESDGFMENNPTMLRRNGADVFYRKPYQKVADLGQVLMGAVDNISTELIVRTKYNEYVRKGMSHEDAVNEADKWASRTMGDRSLGQQPQLYNSKAAGVITKFQLEVRNLLDSQFYDTIQEAKVSNEEIQNKLLRNAKTSAKIASTFTQLAVAQHLFGSAFEKVVGYNPAFDIIETLIKMFGFDDDEDSEDTVLDNIEQGFLNLLEDLPYASVITGGGRIPISSALPIKELAYGKDEYGEKPRGEILAEAIPYYLLPTGYGQIKKTVQGLSMFDDDLPISGSYTESGNLRFPIKDTTENKIKAGLFGQWANENARTYFDKGVDPLKEKQIKEFIEVDMPIKDYWDYREGLKGKKKLEDKFDYIDSLDLPVKKKNILINNIVDRKEDVDMENYSQFPSYEEFDFYSKNPEKYSFLQENNISYNDYAASKESKKAYNWAYNNPEKYTVSKAISSDFMDYWTTTREIYDIKADKDSNGKTINGTGKAKKIDYINNLDMEYGEKIVLFKMLFEYDDTYNYEIIDYLNSREDITYEETETILKQLGFTVTADGNIYWD